MFGSIGYQAPPVSELSQSDIDTLMKMNYTRRKRQYEFYRKRFGVRLSEAIKKKKKQVSCVCLYCRHEHVSACG